MRLALFKNPAVGSIRGQESMLRQSIGSDWRAICTALGMLAESFLADLRTCPRLSRIALFAMAVACVPVATMAQNGTGRAGVGFAGHVGQKGQARVETIVAFTDSALLPVAGLSASLSVIDGSGASVGYRMVSIRPGFALVALDEARQQHFRVCGGGGCRQYRVLRGD